MLIYSSYIFIYCSYKTLCPEFIMFEAPYLTTRSTRLHTLFPNFRSINTCNKCKNKNFVKKEFEDKRKSRVKSGVVNT